MIDIYSFRLGDLQTNTYVLACGDSAVIIDPADDASFLTEEFLRRRLTLRGIVGTHGHFDHMLAVGELQANFNVSYFLNSKDIFLIDRAHETARHFLGYVPVFLSPKEVVPLMPGPFILGDVNLEVIYTPGHTPGGVSFYLHTEGCVFTGDTLFYGSIGRTDFSYAQPKELSRSLKALFRLPPETIVYPGHGDITTIGAESKNMNEYAQLLLR